MNKQETNYKKIRSNKKALVIGSAVVDVIVTIPKLPVSGEDVFSSAQEIIVGGCAYNVGNVLQQLNASYDLMIPIGNGPNAAQINKQMNADGHSQVLKDLDGDNGWCLSMVEPSGERTFLTVPGVENDWQEEWFDKINLHHYDYIYLSGYSFEGNSAKVLLKQLQNKKKETTIIFDPSPRVSEMNQEDLKKLLKMNTIIHCNRDELLSLSEQTDIEAGAKIIHQKTQRPVAVTLGSEGTLFVEDNKIKICHGQEVPLVDTIGAGDTHTGAFIAALLDEQSIETACMWGNNAASKVVQVQGGNVQLF
ncbi:PfkB family carbohydrate kinase [Oceanobacillus jeddahense]|uniref:PfkB family carbohydrate kinase n=1 Tax=Oceanobacillus jeddahense TaxID=1462527 RepID=UPI000595E3C2|nr:PfkB family carbohydrate kinase [Oceanobacillus jeddahense]